MKTVLSLFVLNKLKSLYLEKSFKNLRKKKEKKKLKKEVNKEGREEGKKVVKGREGLMGYIQLPTKINIKIPELQGGVNIPVPHCLIGHRLL